MAKDENPVTDLGIHEECGHAVEAHGASSDGCALCDCGEILGREGTGEGAGVSAPSAEGGANG